MRTKGGEKAGLALHTACVVLSVRLCRQWLLAELEVWISYFVGKGIIYKRFLLTAKCLGACEHTPTIPAFEGRRVATSGRLTRAARISKQCQRYDLRILPSRDVV